MHKLTPVMKKMNEFVLNWVVSLEYFLEEKTILKRNKKVVQKRKKKITQQRKIFAE